MGRHSGPAAKNRSQAAHPHSKKDAESSHLGRLRSRRIKFLSRVSPVLKGDGADADQDENRPLRIPTIPGSALCQRAIFSSSPEKHLRENEILALSRNGSGGPFGISDKVLENPNSSLVEIAGAIERYRHLIPQGVELSSPRERAFRVSLIQRLLNDDPQFVQVAKQFISVNDFHDLLEQTIYPPGSHGRLGGKGAGLFVASQILKKMSADNELLGSVKTPKTWHSLRTAFSISSTTTTWTRSSEHKYKDIGQVRQEYPSIIQVFKSSSFPPEIVNGLVHRAG